jgi:hypothetical protein
LRRRRGRGGRYLRCSHRSAQLRQGVRRRCLRL